MGFAPERRGPHHPHDSTPDLPPSSVRWTSHVDTWSPNGFGQAPARSRGAARELLVSSDGERRVGRQFDIGLDTDGMMRTLLDISAVDNGAPLDLAELVDASVAGGFRNRLTTAIEQTGNGVSELAMFVLDDLPGVTLVSSYAEQYDDAISGANVIGGFMASTPEAIEFQADMCTGWAREAGLVQTLVNDKDLLTPVGPVAPALWDVATNEHAADGAADADAGADLGEWHHIGQLDPDHMRRIRRIDLVNRADGSTTFETHFRDSHADRDGVERVLHEYLVTGTLDTSTSGVSPVITSLTAEARVLPWQECPGAVASAQRAIGAEVSTLRSLVRTTFRGTSTCTHLNDTLRSLESLQTMARHLR